jgi:hypothetical protein
MWYLDWEADRQNHMEIDELYCHVHEKGEKVVSSKTSYADKTLGPTEVYTLECGTQVI